MKEDMKEILRDCKGFTKEMFHTKEMKVLFLVLLILFIILIMMAFVIIGTMGDYSNGIAHLGGVV